MLEWLWQRSVPARHEPETTAAPARGRGRSMSGRYLALHDYLDRRYAGMVVLTLTEMEDILGFALPDEARTTAGWWANPTADDPKPAHQDAWILAGRTAAPNLVNKTVAFERPE